MIEYGFSNIDTNSKEGKMLIAALSMLTSMNGEHNGMINPNDVLKKVIHIANLVYYDVEYMKYLELKNISDNREKTINDII